LQKIDYQFKTDPYAHQFEGFLLTKDEYNFALLMDMGTGKSKVGIDNFSYLFTKNEISAVLIAAPNNVHLNWVNNEIPIHCPDYIQRHVVAWQAAQNKKYQQQLELLFDAGLNNKLPILSMNIEAFSTDKGVKFANRFVNAYSGNVFFIVDESTRIKTPGSKRTKAIMKIGKNCKYKRILTGQPIAQNPLDLYSQFKFLSQDILGYYTFTGFRSDFAETIEKENKQASKTKSKMFGREVKVYYEEIIAYKNLGKLRQLIKPYSFRVHKDQCLDLPPKVFERRYVQLNDEQKKAYKQMRDEMLIDFKHAIEDNENNLSETFVIEYKQKRSELSDDELLAFFLGSDELQRVTASNGAVKRMRLHQITGGYLQDESKEWINVGKTNPKMEELKKVLEEVSGKVIIWAWFRKEIDEIVNIIASIYGEKSVVKYYGGMDNNTKTYAVDSFQDKERLENGDVIDKPSQVRFFVGNTDSAGIGITLTKADYMVYYSQNFKLEARLQSEDRAYRIGHKGTVVYIDLVAEKTVDVDLLNNQKLLRAIANYVTDGAIDNTISNNFLDNDFNKSVRVKNVSKKTLNKSNTLKEFKINREHEDEFLQQLKLKKG